jgi:hypothetical protein
MNIDRNRRYARLMGLAKQADEATSIWAWWSSAKWDTYLFALRYLQHENLATTKAVVDLQLHNKELVHDPN